MAKLALSLGSVGNVRTLTMRAFPEPEYRPILASLRSDEDGASIDIGSPAHYDG